MTGGGQLDLFGGGDAPGRPDPAEAPSPSGLEPAGSHPRLLHVGSCAWNHASFTRHFYPRGLDSARQLAYYARFHNAVEVDSSFYRVPTVETVRRWVGSTPEGFLFAVKAPRSVTHDAGLSLEERVAREDWEAFRRALEAFGGRLGAVLVQLGPRTTALHRGALERVMGTLDRALPRVVEFRHPTWNTADVHGWLAGEGIVRSWTDHYLDPTRGVTESNPWLFAETGPFRFIRLLGDMSTKYNAAMPDGRNFQYGSVLFDRRDDFARWVERVRGAIEGGVAVQVFINNHYEGFAPVTARRLREALAGVTGTESGKGNAPAG